MAPQVAPVVVVESVKLDRDVLVGCQVHGTLRNDSSAEYPVTLILKARHDAGTVIATALANVGFVGAEQTRQLRRLFMISTTTFSLTATESAASSSGTC